jgi:hypothetical protein
MRKLVIFMRKNTTPFFILKYLNIQELNKYVYKLIQEDLFLFQH